ncbi:MAG: hypothetical protein QF904_00850 [Gemmatimonadota bacterium]|jgi:hypothetical protein|nr:hypothetical protein [Gemmatimonadota bacterium]
MKTTLLVAAILSLTVSAALGASSTATGVSNDMNPAISFNALFLGQWNDGSSTADENFARLQEAEVQFTSAVDPFWAADVVVAFHPAHDHEDGEGHGLETDLEVAALTSTAMPAGLGLTLGRFYLPFGRHAMLHTHQYPFARAPLAQRRILGDHGLSEVGAAVDASLPLPWWSEVMVYGVNGDAEIFNPHEDALVVGAHWSNLFDLGDDATFELGGSYLSGPGAPHEDETGNLAVAGFDATWKWTSSAKSHGPAAEVSVEAYLPDAEHGEANPVGWFALARYRVHRDWWVGAGCGEVDGALEHDHEKEDGERADWTEWKAAVTYAPSHFSSLRGEVSRTGKTGGEAANLRASVQWNFTIGSHPAHLY